MSESRCTCFTPYELQRLSSMQMSPAHHPECSAYKQIVPRVYAHDQSHIPPVEHAHDKEQERIACGLAEAISEFSAGVEDLNVGGGESLGVVLPPHLYACLAAKAKPDSLIQVRAKGGLMMYGKDGGVVITEGT